MDNGTFVFMPSGTLHNDDLCEGTDNGNGIVFDVIDNDAVFGAIGIAAELRDVVVSGNDDDADDKLHANCC